MLRKKILLLSTFSILLVSGLVHGLITDRWNDPQDIEKAIDALHNVPLQIDGWNGEIISKGPEKDSGLFGSISAKFKHHLTEKEITVFLGCGRSGKVSVHTPDVCYATSGFEVESQSTVSFSNISKSRTGKAFSARFTKAKGGDQTLLRIYWTWYVGGEWTISDNPRLQFHNQKILYKLYIIQDLDNLDNQISLELCEDLLLKLTDALQISGTLTGM